MSPREFSFVFSANALAFFAAAQANEMLGRRFGIQRVIVPAATGFGVCMLIMAVFVLMGQTSLFLMLGLMFVSFAFLGLIIPPVSVLALANHGDIAGTAASVMNTIQLVLGAAAIAISGMLADGTPTPMVLGMAGCAVLTLVSSLWTFGRQKIAEPA